MTSHQVFISYRREDSAGHAARLAAELQRDYDDETVFFDQSTIKAGEPFPDRLQNAVTQSEIVLAIVGARWLSCKTEEGKRRLDEKGDWVRKELRCALSNYDGRSRTVIPVLVEGVSMPRKAELPAPLAEFAVLHAVTLPDAAPLWRRAYLELLARLDEKLGISPEERDRDWIYDVIARDLDELSGNQRLKVGDYLTALDGIQSATAISPRALAKRFYRIGPLAMESLRKSRRFDESLRPMLERLKDYWVTTEASDILARTWVGQYPFRATIVRGRETPFTPTCIVQKASNDMTEWRVHSVVSEASQPSAPEVIADIHDWLRGEFASPIRRAGLPDAQEERVTSFLRQRLAQKAAAGRPFGVQLDEVGAADKSLIRAIQETFPHLRLLILVPGEESLRDLEGKYFDELERQSTTLVSPEASSGDEQRAAEAYRAIDEELLPE